MDVDIPPIREVPVTAMFDAVERNSIVVSLFTPSWINWFSDISDALNQVASSSLFTATTDGIVPASGGGTTNFLRADGTWAAPPGGGGVSDGDKGDITVSGGGTVWTIDNDAVTFAKMQNIATDRLIGRDTAASGDPEEIAVNGGIEFGGAANIQRSALTGDVTATAGSNATTIANNTVTNAKAADMATATLKGRTTAGTGDPEDLTGTQATTLLSNLVGDSGSGGTKGLAPAPAAGDAAAAKFLKADGTWAVPATGSGAQGSATINFGAAPGTNLVSIAVTGQAGIVAGSQVQAFLMGNDSTATHNTDEHKILANYINFAVDTIVAGVGFTINAITELRLTGTMVLRWRWS